MGRKLKDSTTPAFFLVIQNPPQNPESKIKKKKKKKKKKKQRNKDKAEEPEANNPKRKHEEIKAKEKKSKNKKPKKDDKESKTHQGKEKDETIKDGLVVVSEHNVKLGKYAPLKSFVESSLPQEVLECHKNFQSPSSIQSRAWPFLLDAWNFIGIQVILTPCTLFLYKFLSNQNPSFFIFVMFVFP